LITKPNRDSGRSAKQVVESTATVEATAVVTPASTSVAVPRYNSKNIGEALRKAANAPASASSEYAELKKIIKAQGLMDKRPLYYVFKITSTLAMLGTGIAVMVLADSVWIHLLNAVFLGLVFTQFGYLGHDAGHRQISENGTRNEVIGLVINFLIGIHRGWWVDQHNIHHSNPNDDEEDPHIAIPVLAFSHSQYEKKPLFLKRIVRFQAFYFFPLLMLEGLGIRLAGIQFTLRGGKSRYSALEPALMVAYGVTYLAVVFFLLGPVAGLLFIAVHQAVFGVYMGSVFAPNHKGMLMPEKGNKLGFLRLQVLTTRNVKPGLFNDFWFGGLNYQIEHHLFPTMPRKNLGRAQSVIKQFCAEREIPFYETSAMQSYKEILAYLHECGNPAKSGASVS